VFRGNVNLAVEKAETAGSSDFIARAATPRLVAVRRVSASVPEPSARRRRCAAEMARQQVVAWPEESA